MSAYPYRPILDHNSTQIKIESFNSLSSCFVCRDKFLEEDPIIVVTSNMADPTSISMCIHTKCYLTWINNNSYCLSGMIKYNANQFVPSFGHDKMKIRVSNLYTHFNGINRIGDITCLVTSAPNWLITPSIPLPSHSIGLIRQSIFNIHHTDDIDSWIKEPSERELLYNHWTVVKSQLTFKQPISGIDVKNLINANIEEKKLSYEEKSDTQNPYLKFASWLLWEPKSEKKQNVHEYWFIVGTYWNDKEIGVDLNQKTSIKQKNSIMQSITQLVGKYLNTELLKTNNATTLSEYIDSFWVSNLDSYITNDKRVDTYHANTRVVTSENVKNPNKIFPVVPDLKSLSKDDFPLIFKHIPSKNPMENTEQCTFIPSSYIGGTGTDIITSNMMAIGFTYVETHRRRINITFNV